MKRPASMRPAFALAMAMIVMVVVGALTGVLLERQSVQTLAVRRQMDQYQEHHGKKGLSEVIEAYLLALQTTPISQLVSQDPHLFDIELADGAVAEIRVRNAQGRMLSDLSDLSGPRRERGERALAILRREVEDDELSSLLRPSGPLEIDAQSADPRVLRAVIASVLSAEDEVETLTADLLRMREERELTRADLGRAMTGLNLDNELRQDLTEMLTVQPSIWSVRVDLTAPDVVGGPRRLIAAYEGLAQLATRRSSRVGRGNLFLSFEPIRLDTEGSPPASGREPAR